MTDVTILLIILGFLALCYAVRELDPNRRTPEQSKREAMDARLELQTPDDDHADFACVQRARRGAPKK